MAAVTGAPVQELSLAEVVPTAVDTGILDDGKLDFVMVTVEESASVQVRSWKRVAFLFDLS